MYLSPIPKCGPLGTPLLLIIFFRSCATFPCFFVGFTMLYRVYILLSFSEEHFILFYQVLKLLETHHDSEGEKVWTL